MWVEEPDGDGVRFCIQVPQRAEASAANKLDSHTMTQMGHNIPNLIGVDTRKLDKRMRKLRPRYMTLGATGMAAMAR